jgi:glycosyltransferase involved in cell wall biosynthesis
MRAVTLLKAQLFKQGGLEKYTWALARDFCALGSPVTILTSGDVKPPFSHPLLKIVSLPVDHALSFLNVAHFEAACKKYLAKHPTPVVFGLDRNSFQTHIRAGNGSHAAYLHRRAAGEGFIKKVSFAVNPLHRMILALEKKGFEHPDLRVLFTNSQMVRQEILQFYQTDPSKIIAIHNGVEWQAMQEAFDRWESEREKIYCAHSSCVNFGSARQSQIAAKHSDRARPLLNSKASEAAETREGPGDLRSEKQVNVLNRAERFGKVAASQNSHNLNGRSITAFQFLFAGHNFFRKGLDKLLHALALIKDEHFQLSVVGHDKNADFFKDLAAKLNLSQKVFFFGPQKEMARFYSVADCLVIPSLYDPFANVTVEALAMGLFVVSSKTNGGHEILTPQNGVVVESLEDATAFSQILKNVLQHRKTSAGARAIRQSVKHLDFSSQLRRMTELTLA